MKNVTMLYGKTGLDIRVPDSADVLHGLDVPAIADPDAAVAEALASPIGSPSLRELVLARKPNRVAITISDITRPVPNKAFLPGILKALNDAGVRDEQIVIIVGTGMHRPSTPDELELMIGRETLARVETIDHDAHAPATLVKISDDPPVSICRRFAQADFRIVTGYIEPHFMAGFSGGRKGVCPAMVDLATIQRFHGYRTLADPKADNGVLDGNPCHAIALKVAKAVGVDFLFNVAITRTRQIAGIFCGDLEQAHLAGCRQVAKWTTAVVERPYDLAITNGGGFPLDQTFYQTVKGMCTALPALDSCSTLLVVSHCGEMVGSPAYTQMMLQWAGRWQEFLKHIAAEGRPTQLDQWELQMQARVLDLIGHQRLWLVTDGIPADMQRSLTVNPILCCGDARDRAQKAINEFTAARPEARIAVIPDGPYTMLTRA